MNYLYTFRYLCMHVCVCNVCTYIQYITYNSMQYRPSILVTYTHFTPFHAYNVSPNFSIIRLFMSWSQFNFLKAAQQLQRQDTLKLVLRVH